MDRQCKKTQTIYLWTDSAKKTTNNLPMDRQCKKQQTIYLWTDSAKNNKQFTYGQTVQKKQQQFTYGQTVQKNCTVTDSAKKNTYLHFKHVKCHLCNIQNV